MLRSIKRFTPLISLSILTKTYENDIDYLNRPPPQAPKTGWERVKKMYTVDEEGVSIELRNVGQTVMVGSFLGGCIGGFVGSKSAYLYFIENNQATLFKSTMEAKKKLQDKVTIAFAKGAVQWGWRLAAFSGIYSLAATTISVYRDDTSLIDFISGGAIAGGMYKLNLGLVATFVGAGLGAVLGLVFGSIIIMILKVTGLKMDEIRKGLLAFGEERKQQMDEAFEKSSRIKHDELTKHHDDLVEEKGKQKIDQIV